MDIISQLQEQVDTIAWIAFNTFGTLQRDAPPVRLSPNYPEPTVTNPNPNPNPNSQPPPTQQPSAATKQPQPEQLKPLSQEDFDEEVKKASAGLVNAAKQGLSEFGKVEVEVIDQLKSNVKVAKEVSLSRFKFDALVNALPLTEGGEEAQLKRIAELQAENDAIGQELQKQLEAADEELKQVQELFNQASDNCLNMKKPY